MLRSRLKSRSRCAKQLFNELRKIAFYGNFWLWAGRSSRADNDDVGPSRSDGPYPPSWIRDLGLWGVGRASSTSPNVGDFGRLPPA